MPGLNPDHLTEAILFSDTEVSVHDGIPRPFYHLRNTMFGEWQIPPWELTIYRDRVLGDGTFSRVYLAKWRETYVVAKVISRELLEFKKYLIEREIDIMSKLHHPNIVQFLGFVENPFVIVMEYIPNGNLQTRIPHLKLAQKLQIMRNILQALLYLHIRKPHSLIHRDIKPTNILLTTSNFAKISDFGLSRFHCLQKSLSHDDLSNLEHDNTEWTDVVGTERYLAPEMTVDNKLYTNKIDIYSTGILLYELFENTRYRPADGFHWYKCPRSIRRIIEESMLQQSPEHRSDAQTILHRLDEVSSTTLAERVRRVSRYFWRDRGVWKV